MRRRSENVAWLHRNQRVGVETLIYSAEGGANNCARAGAVERANNLFQNARARSGRRCPNRREVPGVARTLVDWTSSAETGVRALRKAAAKYMSTAGVDVYVFRPNVPMDLSDELKFL